MSELRKKLEWAPTGRRVPVTGKLPVVSAEQTFTPNLLTAAEIYQLRLTLSVSVAVSEVERHLVDEPYSLVVKNARQQIIEAVFGEFRQPIMDVERAVFERDWGEALHAIQRLRAQLFDE